MPGYAGTAQATLLRENSQAYLFNNELVAVGELSVAYELARINRSSYPWGLSFEVVFSASPGTFEIDIVGANNDLAANYLLLTSGNITSASGSTVTGAFVARYDMPTNVWPKYVAAYVKTFPNAATVKVTSQVTR